MEPLPYISKIPCSLLQGAAIAVARPRNWEPACGTERSAASAKRMGVPPGNHRVLVPRRTSERYVAGADTRGRQEGRPYPWSQQVIHEMSGLLRSALKNIPTCILDCNRQCSFRKIEEDTIHRGSLPIKTSGFLPRCKTL